MPHIDVDATVPGMRSLLLYRPDTAEALNMLAERLLRGPSGLTPGERETIAAFVSSRNECRFCTGAHSAAAKHTLGGGDREAAIVEAVKLDYREAPVSPKMKALLAIADKVRGDARRVTAEDVAAAKAEGATDRDVHDAVLIAAAFCMYNRYVDGLAATTPADPRAYDAIGARLAKNGYL